MICCLQSPYRLHNVEIDTDMSLQVNESVFHSPLFQAALQSIQPRIDELNRRSDRLATGCYEVPTRSLLAAQITVSIRARCVLDQDRTGDA